MGETLDIKGEVPFHLHIVSTYTSYENLSIACVRICDTQVYIRDNVSFQTAQK